MDEIDKTLRKSEPTRQVNFRLPASVVAMIQKLAAKAEKSQAAVVEAAVRDAAKGRV